MSDIISLKQISNEQVMGEINVILNKHGKILHPEVKISTSGMSFAIHIIDKPRSISHGDGQAPQGERGTKNVR